MKFKLDENLSRQTAVLISSAGHDVQTVPSEKLTGSSDADIYYRCCKEKRCLVTLDLDFSDITRFSPELCSGIIIIRLHRNSSHDTLLLLIREFLDALKQMEFMNNLWIVEPGRIRMHKTEEGD